MATGPITSWQIKGEDMEAVTDFTFLDSMITADGDSSPEIKRHLLLGRKAMTNLDSILKSRDITLPTELMLLNCGAGGALESPLDCKENKPINSKGNQP